MFAYLLNYWSPSHWNETQGGGLFYFCFLFHGCIPCLQHAWGTLSAQERNIDEINYALNLTHEKSQTHGAYKN